MLTVSSGSAAEEEVVFCLARLSRDCVKGVVRSGRPLDGLCVLCAEFSTKPRTTSQSVSQVVKSQEEEKHTHSRRAEQSVEKD